MPADRTHSANNARPLAPHLAAMRTTKSPVTPKLASSVAPAGTSSSPVVRGDRSDAVATTRLNTTSREEHCTPVKSFLNSNVTPRSSSRKSRVGTSNSASSTPSLPPSAPPSTTRPASKCDFANKNSLCSPSGNGSAGLGCTSTTKRPKSVIGGACNQQTPVQRPPLSSTYSYTKCEAATSRASSPMFFHASDAKTPQTGFNSKKGRYILLCQWGAGHPFSECRRFTFSAMRLLERMEATSQARPRDSHPRLEQEFCCICASSPLHPTRFEPHRVSYAAAYASTVVADQRQHSPFVSERSLSGHSTKHAW